MYYVIQELKDIKNKHFVSYTVPKYIDSPKNANIIFEFGEKPNIKRKWAPKEEIIFLTSNKELFLTFLSKLKKIEKEYLDKIALQEEILNQLYQDMKDDMHDIFEYIKETSNENNLLK